MSDGATKREIRQWERFADRWKARGYDPMTLGTMELEFMVLSRRYWRTSCARIGFCPSLPDGYRTLTPEGMFTEFLGYVRYASDRMTPLRHERCLMMLGVMYRTLYNEWWGNGVSIDCPFTEAWELNRWDVLKARIVTMLRNHLPPCGRFTRMDDFTLGIILLAVAVIAIVCVAVILYTKLMPSYLATRWRFEFNGKTYDMTDDVDDAMTLAGDSVYAGRHMLTVMLDDMAMFPTIDDPVVIRLAEHMAERTKGMSDLDKANYILRFVQDGTKYVLDKDRFGQWETERWVFPVDTLEDRVGDCEDTSFLCAGLMHLCGLDVVTVSLPGHICVGIHFDDDPNLGGNVYTEADTGKRYYHVETIERHAIGEFTKDLGQPDFMFHCKVPDEQFISRLRPKVDVSATE